MKTIIQLLCALVCVTVTRSANAQTTAAFSADITKGCGPLIVQFKDASTGNASFWRWDFGNGNTSSQQNPGVIYTEPGLYTVKLVAGNANGTDSVIKLNFIEVYGKPQVAFTANPRSGCLPMQVQFTNQSNPVSGTIASVIWDFGDGKISAEANPSHIYTTKNSFNVSLTVQNSMGCKQVLQEPAYIQTTDAVTADFNYTYANACQSPSVIRFTDASTGADNFTYKWLFGDGDSSSLASPEHTFTTGSYWVQQIVFSPGGCSDTVLKNITIGSIRPGFELSSSACSGKALNFTNTSSPAPLSVTWSFGDGGTAGTVNATHTYAVAGSYAVKMIADFGTCTDSITRTINISNKPVTAFSAGAPSSECASSASVQFTNNTTGATSYRWLFGDGNSSTAFAPSHLYNQPGYADVTLISYNASGCSDTLTQSKLVHIGAARITGLSNLPYAGCAPKTVTTGTITDGSQTITSWLWNFGDGTTSTEATPTHSYDTAGTYNVSVSIKTSAGCTDTFSLQQAVLLASKPVAAFNATPRSVCGSRPVTFSDSSTGAVTTWLWDFGDNTTSTLQNPKHGYKDTGYYRIKLIVSNNYCSDTLEKERYVYVNAPIARFSPTLQCDQPYVRTFTDRSIAAQSWEWNFGDGNSSGTKSPSHTYAAAGRYNVVLVVTNSSCNDTARATVIIADEKPAFTVTPSGPYCRKQNLRFTATNYTAANISAFNWNYGNGNTSGFGSNASISYAYSTPGNYTASLTVRDVNGCTVTTQQPVAFDIYGPTAAFTNPAGTCLKNDGNISFTDQTRADGTNALTNWRWDFGDGQVAEFNGAPFTHTYTRAGTFAVKLVVTDASGCKDSIIKNQAVTIADPKADFSLSDTVRCAANNVSFTNQSQGLSLSYRWYFGDGKQSTLANPSNAYASQGQYSIALAVRDRLGCTDSIYKENILLVSNPSASFTLTDTFANCPPLIARPQNTSQYYSSVTWNFDDGATSILPNAQHAYTMGGIYNLTLITRGFGNCTDTARQKITILGPSGTIQYNPLFACAPAPTAFRATTKNTQTIVWDFSDGTLLNTNDSIVSHTYTGHGKYTPRLILTDSFNCRVSVVGKDTLTVAEVMARLNAVQQSGCDSSLMAFTNASQVYNDRITGYSWNFGDNSPAARTANTTHYYRTEKTYQVSLTVNTAQGCRNTVTQSLPVRVYASPVIRFSAPDSACFGSPVRFEASDNTADPAVNSWQLLYGNGQSANTQNATYTYPDAGVYPVRVIARNEQGCADTADHKTTILALPKVDAGPDTSICRGTSIRLTPSGADRYTWQTNTSLNCSSCDNPVANPVTGTRYYVQGSTRFGCVANDSLYVDVKQPPKLTGYRNDSLCAGDSVQFQVSGAETYRWTPATGLSNANIPNPVARPSTTTTYQLIGADTKNCFSERINVRISVFPIPVFNILGDSVRQLNIGYHDTLRSMSSDDINRWEWTPGNWLSCNRCPEPIATPQRDITYTARVYNAGGCSSSDQVTIHVLCNGDNIFMPNTFSPNNDGMNDQFYPRGRGLTSIKSLRIFNRWGQPVFERLNFTANSAADGWDGYFGGKPASADVYVYIMEVVCANNTIVTYKGNIALLR